MDFVRGGGLKYALPILLVGVLLLIACASFDGEDMAEAMDEETRIAEMCAMTDGVGECRVMLTFDTDGRVTAVAVLCEGADRAEVRRSITDMLTSLYGIGSNRISVLKISDKKV